MASRDIQATKEIKMLSFLFVSNPEKPGSISFALFRNKEEEQALRNNAAQQNLICGPTHAIEPTDDFWKFRDWINRK